MAPDFKKRLMLRLFVLGIMVLLALLRPRVNGWISGAAPPDPGGRVSSGPVSQESSGLPAERPTLEIVDPADESRRVEAPDPGENENAEFVSAAGLRYGRGSVDGHRLKHVLQHAQDDPQKRIHGVFDGDREQIIATIDEAWKKGRKGGPDVRSEQQNDRQVLTVKLSRRVGYVGGSEGRRQKFPECRYVRIVLEDDRNVISAYPTRSF